MTNIKPGKYRHFKGNEYEVIDIARHSETMEEMVVYRALYGEQGLWVRPASMWNETVEREGKVYQRFTYIGDEEPADTNENYNAEYEKTADTDEDCNIEYEEEYENLYRKNGRPVVKLSVVMEAFEMASDDWTYFYDLKENENIFISDSGYADDEEERKLLDEDPDRFIRLPAQYEIHEYGIMESFIEDEIPAGSIQDSFYNAIRGRGAFRRFKDMVNRFGMDPEWYSYLEKAHHRMAVEWCEENELDYE